MLNAIPIDPPIPMLIKRPRRPLNRRVEITHDGLPDVVEAVRNVGEHGIIAGFLAIIVDPDQGGAGVSVHVPEFEADHVLRCSNVRTDKPATKHSSAKNRCHKHIQTGVS